jgi:hypothetical protein
MGKCHGDSPPNDHASNHIHQMSTVSTLPSVEAWATMAVEECLLKLSNLCDDVERIRAKGGTGESAVVASMIPGFQRVDDLLQAGGDLLVSKAAGEYRIVYLIKEILDMVRDWCRLKRHFLQLKLGHFAV